MPIVIHSRDADFDTFDIVTKLKVKVPVDLHCYSGSYELAMRYIANGIDIHFGIGGVVTFKNAKRLVIKALEFVMKKEKFTYYDIYTVRKVVKRIKYLNKNYGVYKFVKKIKLF